MSDEPAAETSAAPRRRRLRPHVVLWGLLFFALAAWPVLRYCVLPRYAELPVLGTLPAFTLTDDRGQPFGQQELRGRVWLVNFIFTRCPTICPRLTEKMVTFQERTKEARDALHLLSFSVDPDYDTPPVLAAYARKFKADSVRWRFLTGSLERIQQVVGQGFKIAMGTEGDRRDPNNIFHGTHVVLVDHELQIRGYYEVTEEDAVERLLADAATLVARMRGPR